MTPVGGIDPIARLAGALRVFPGRPVPNVESTRAELAPRIARGRAADAVPALLASVFSLCSGAQRLVARAAIDAARGGAATATASLDDDRTLQLDTVREHLRRLWLDWPEGLGIAVSARESAALGEVVAAGGDTLRAALPGWMQRHALAMPADRWLAHWCEDPTGWLGVWAHQTDTLPARVLRAAQVGALSLVRTPEPLRVHADPATIAVRLAALAHEPGFALRPAVADAVAPETGPWTRLADPLARPGERAYAPVWTRLGARLAELARLALPDAPGAAGAGWLARGAVSPAPDVGLAWAETARGLLVHRVRLAGDTVADWRALAPTEWNFHPSGPVARLLAGLRPSDDTPRVRLIAAAFDPCVTLHAMPQAEAADA